MIFYQTTLDETSAPKLERSFMFNFEK